MEKSLKKHSSNSKKIRTPEPEVKKISEKDFLAGVTRIEPVHIKGYVCLF